MTGLLSFRAESRNLMRSLHSFHSVEMTEGEEALRFPTCGRLPVAFRDDRGRRESL